MGQRKALTHHSDQLDLGRQGHVLMTVCGSLQYEVVMVRVSVVTRKSLKSQEADFLTSCFVVSETSFSTAITALEQLSQVPLQVEPSNFSPK